MARAGWSGGGSNEWPGVEAGPLGWSSRPPVVGRARVAAIAPGGGSSTFSPPRNRVQTLRFLFDSKVASPWRWRADGRTAIHWQLRQSNHKRGRIGASKQRKRAAPRSRLSKVECKKSPTRGRCFNQSAPRPQTAGSHRHLRPV